MTQPRDDDDTSRRNRRSRQDRSEPQAPQSEATGPVVYQPGDEDAVEHAIDSAESRDEVQDGGQHADHDDGRDSDADEQDSSETAESTETTTLCRDVWVVGAV